MDYYGNLIVPNMSINPSEKFRNIHINPSFHEPKKSVIHINPKVQLNVQVHVNPKMVNALSASGPQRRPDVSVVPKNPIVSNSNILKPSSQKSVYVNPKLMQKLTSKRGNVVPNIVNTQQAVIQPQSTTINRLTVPIKTKTKIINNTKTKIINNTKMKFINNTKTSNVVNIINVKKNSPSKLVLISNRKLVRERPSPKVGQTDTPVVIKKVKPHKLVNVDPSKKFISSNGKIFVKNKLKSSPVKSTPVTSTSANKNKYKIDRTKVQKSPKKKINKVLSRHKVVSRSNTNTNLINIGGVLYKSSKSQLVKSNGASQTSGMKRTSAVSTGNRIINNSRSKSVYKKVKPDGKIVKLKSTSPKLNISKSSITSFMQKSNYKCVLSNRAKQKSIQILRQKMSKNNQPCLLYQRFGYCAKFVEGTCPKVHDKKQIALCRNFLQGKCLLDNCPLSHEVGPEKMPTCRYFLDGCCVRDSCQYLHVKVSANTPICIAFLRGYCEKGTQCKERHTNICPEFEKIGKCSKGKNCPYPHKSLLLAKRKSCKKPKATTFNKQTVVKKDKPLASIIRDESKKRYYDEDNLDDVICLDDDDLSQKRKNILSKLNTMKSLHLASEQNLAIAQDTSDISNNLHHQQQPDISSQPSSNQNVLLRRQPIGPLPAYIPIE